MQRTYSILSKICLFLVLFFLIPSLSHADALSLGEDIPYFYYEDESGSLSLEQFLNMPSHRLTESKKILSKGYTESTFWVKTFINEERFIGHKYWFEILPIFLDKVDFFYKPGGSFGWKKRSAGDLNSQADWDLDYRSAVFMLPESSTGYDVIIKVSTTSSMLLNVKLWEGDDFLSYALKDNAFWNFFFGLFFLTGMFSFILAVVFNKREFWAAFFVCSVYVAVFCVQGYYDWFFGKGENNVQHYLVSFFSITSFSVALWVCSEMLGLYDRFLVMYKATMVIFFVMLFQTVFVFFDMFLFSIRIVYALFVIGAFLMLMSFLYCFSKYRFGFFYLLLGCGAIILLSVSLVRLFTLNGWVTYTEKGSVLWQALISVNVVLVIVTTSFKIYKEKINNIERQSLAKELNFERDVRFQQRMFINMLSHEFRTSLAVISGALTNLKSMSNGENEFISKRYNRIERANERLIQLTDNCLADDRISSDEQIMNFSKVNLVEIVGQVKKVVDVSERHKINFYLNGMPINFEDFPELYLKADSAMLQIAISNILDNALKYMDEGDINFEIIISQECFIIRIEDHGPGIGSDHVYTIFDRYKRAVDAEGERQKNGFGLGLYIAKRILLAHGGDIELIKNSNKGCCFELIIPNDFTGV